MKIFITIVVFVVLGYLFFAYSSKAPEGVERAVTQEEGASATSGTNTNTDASAGADVNAETDVDVAGTNATSPNTSGSSSTTATSASIAAQLAAKYKIQDLTFKFTGYGPGGKTEEGAFKKITVSEIKNSPVSNPPISAVVTIDTSSVSTGKAGLDKHLCADDFFNCAKYPNIVFTLKKLSMTSSSKVAVTGTLEYNGAKKDVTFDMTVDPINLSASADFLLDTTAFKFKYTGVNKDVRIQFGFKVAEVK